MATFVPSEETFSEVCLRNFIGVDITALEQQNVSKEGLKSLAIRNARTLLKRIYELPAESSEEGRLVVIPTRQSFLLPRQNPVPAPQPKTRWQKFAEAQNIHKRKRSRLVWDDAVNDWVPRWGKGSSKKIQQKLNEAVIELKDNEDIRTVIESRRADAKLGKNKQQLRELRNKVEAAGGRLPYAAATPGIPAMEKNNSRRGKDVIAEMNRRAAVSTASFGVYNKKVDVQQKSLKKGAQKSSRPTKKTGPKRSDKTVRKTNQKSSKKK